MENLPFAVRERQGEDVWDKRWIIVSPDTSEILDDAQGCGYKSKQNAIKAGWYKFGGGKRKLDAATKEADLFWRQHKDFARKVNQLQEDWFKEIATGEIDFEKEVASLAKELGVDGFHGRFLK
jgi:hypothetical protein